MTDRMCRSGGVRDDAIASRERLRCDAKKVNRAASIASGFQALLDSSGRFLLAAKRTVLCAHAERQTNNAPPPHERRSNLPFGHLVIWSSGLIWSAIGYLVN